METSQTMEQLTSTLVGMILQSLNPNKYQFFRFLNPTML